MAREFSLLVVGKLKDNQLESLEKDYLKRIISPHLVIHEVKASAENKDSEGEALLRKIKDIAPGGAHVVAMTEWGKKMSSIDFAKWTQELIEKPQKVIFVIAGAEGFSSSFLSVCHDKISLSELTFPHKIARLLLVEQIYRAQTIRTNHPYHN